MDVLIYILIGVLSRILPHPANFTAVGGLAVFGGLKLPLKKALLVTFFTMLFADIVIGFHSAMWATYLGMIAAVGIGHIFARQSGGLGNSVIAAMISSVFFFIITNFAVWAGWQTMYPRNISGLIECYIAAIPFFRNSILGDIVYTTIFVMIYDLLFLKNKSEMTAKEVIQ
jgi:hypothetical protein